MADEPTNDPQVTATVVEGTQTVQQAVEPTGAEAPATEPSNSGLPEGFSSWEEYGKAQYEAQQKAKEGGSEETEETEQSAPTEVDQALENVPEANREKARPFFEEFARAGDLSDESVKKAAEAFGVSEDMVRLYVKGAQAETQAQLAPFEEAAGGKEALDAFRAWAEANYTPEQAEAYNAALEQDPLKAVTDAVAAWRAAGNGPAPRDLTKDLPGSRGKETIADGYASEAEMIRDMRDPRYASDPAFRAKVEAKIGAASFSISRRL